MEKATKQCTKCGRELPITEFTICKKAKDGLSYWCKECNSKAQRDLKIHRTFRPDVIKLFSDSELFDELKNRGYSGDLVKKLSL